MKENNIFFIGIAGVGMSAIAQYLTMNGKKISGSDREFSKNKNNDIKNKLEHLNIKCFSQDAGGINKQTELVVVSTAVEKNNLEYKKAISFEIPIIHRAELLAQISKTKKTIAISGTSGKSTSAAMLFHILQTNNIKTSLISGAGLISLQEQGFIGNAYADSGEWLIIEADESDGSLVRYEPEIGIILNIDKDHKTISELQNIFQIFANNSKILMTNSNQSRAKYFSKNKDFDFGLNEDCGLCAKNFKQNGFSIQFSIQNTCFSIPLIGKFNMENALSAIAAAKYLGLSLEKISNSLKTYKGIYRRTQIIGRKDGIMLIDDFAHNPIKIKSVIKAAQKLSERIIIWFQPHGFAPTKFLKDDFITEISDILRSKDLILMSEIYYAGGSVSKNISANDLIKGIRNNGKNALFVKNRKNLIAFLNKETKKGDIILLTGARDPSLGDFANYIFDNL